MNIPGGIETMPDYAEIGITTNKACICLDCSACQLGPGTAPRLALITSSLHQGSW